MESFVKEMDDFINKYKKFTQTKTSVKQRPDKNVSETFGRTIFGLWFMYIARSRKMVDLESL